MNHSITGWESGPSHRFPNRYGIQRAWHRIKEEPPKNPKDLFKPLENSAEQYSIPAEWLKTEKR